MGKLDSDISSLLISLTCPSSLPFSLSRWIPVLNSPSQFSSLSGSYSFFFLQRKNYGESCGVTVGFISQKSYVTWRHSLCFRLGLQKYHGCTVNTRLADKKSRLLESQLSCLHTRFLQYSNNRRKPVDISVKKAPGRWHWLCYVEWWLVKSQIKKWKIIRDMHKRCKLKPKQMKHYHNSPPT